MAIHATTLPMPAHTSVTIEAPVDVDNGQGYFAPAADKKFRVNGELRSHIRGFISENEDVGTIEPGDDNKLEIKYSQLESKENRMWFFTATEETYLISIIAIPIHDHSSIYQGGPAYGTYAYDKPSEEAT